MQTHSHLILGKYREVSPDSSEKKTKLLRGNHAEHCLAVSAYKKHIKAIALKEHSPNTGFSATTASTPLTQNPATLKGQLLLMLLLPPMHCPDHE